MTTKRTGRPRGAPKKSFLSDPDRHTLAFIAVAMAIYGLNFEHAALLALCLDSEPIELPPNPLRQANRLKLSQATKRKLGKGWLLRWYERSKPPQTTGGRIDTLRKKAKRLATDESAKKWLYYMRIVMRRCCAMALPPRKLFWRVRRRRVNGLTSKNYGCSGALPWRANH
jgi:hypothetical protein